MAKIILEKSILSKIAEFNTTNQKIDRIVLSVKGEEYEIAYQFSDAGKILDEIGQADEVLRFLGTCPKTEQVRITVKEDAESFAAFLIGSANSSDETSIEFSGSEKKVKLSTGEAWMKFNAEVSGTVGNLLDLGMGKTPILSFKKEEFKKLFGGIAGLNSHNSWVNKKIAGLSVIVSTDSAHIYSVIKAFHFKKPINVGTFYPEAARTFVHDEGSIFLNEDTLKRIFTILESENEDAEVKLFCSTPCSDDEITCQFGITIGNSIAVTMYCISRKKWIQNSKTIVDPYLSEKVKNEASVSKVEFDKFIKPFNNNPIFMGNVMKMKLSAKKGISFTPVEDQEAEYGYSVEDKSVDFDDEIGVNFFVLKLISESLDGEKVIIQERASNPKRFVMTDGISWFVVGKTLKKEG